MDRSRLGTLKDCAPRKRTTLVSRLELNDPKDGRSPFRTLFVRVERYRMFRPGSDMLVPVNDSHAAMRRRQPCNSGANSSH